MESTVFCVGEQGKIRHRSAAGVWSDHSPAGLGMNDKFWGVWGVSENEVYAVGRNISTGANLFYAWDGESWGSWSNPPTIDSDHTPIHIFGLSSDLIWVTAERFNYGISKIYQWDGDSWSTIYNTNKYRHATWASDSDNLYAVGATGSGPPYLFRYISGTSWESDSSITNDYLGDISGIAESNGIIFCHRSANVVWRGTFNSMVKDTVGTISFKNDMSGQGGNGIFSQDGKCWVCGDDGQPKVAHYDGSSWSITALDASSSYGSFRAVTGSSFDDIIIIAGNGGALCDAFIFDGSSWTKESVGQSDFRPMAAWMMLSFTGTTASDFDEHCGVHRRCFAKISGIEPIFWQHSSLGQPTGWDRSIKTCLHPPTSLSMDLDPSKGIEGIGGLTLEVDDIRNDDGTYYFGSLLAAAGWLSGEHTFLISDSSPAATFIGVAMDNLPSSGTAYIGDETFTYTGISPTFGGFYTLDGVSRPLYPAIDGCDVGKYYRARSDGEEGARVSVAEKPFSLIGRMVALYVVTYDRSRARWNSEEDAFLLWAGRITDKISHDSAKNTWKISCVSLIDDLERKIAYKNRSSTLAPVINISGLSDARRTISIDHQYIDNYTDVYFTINSTDIVIDGRNYSIPKQVWNLGIKLEYGYIVWEKPDNKLYLSAEIKGNRVVIRAEARYQVTQGEQSGYARLRNFRNHVMQAFGFDVSLDSMTEPLRYSHNEEPGWFVYAAEFKAQNAYFISYQPVNLSYNERYIYITNMSHFINDQGDHPTKTIAAMRVKDVKVSADQETKMTLYIRYDSSDQYNSDDGNMYYRAHIDPTTQWHISDIEDPMAHIGVRNGSGKEIFVEQVFIPWHIGTTGDRGPFDLLLRMLLSTGHAGYNHATYDCLIEEYGIGIPAALVNVESFENADKLIGGNHLSDRSLYPIDSNKTFKELVEAECKLFGFAMCFQDGQYSIVEMMPPRIDDYVATIDDSVIMDYAWQPRFDMSTAQIINQYDCYLNFDHLLGKFTNPIVVQDIDSLYGINMTKSMKVEHKGIWENVFHPIDAKLLESQFLGRFIRFPMPIIELPIAHILTNKIHTGCVVKFNSSKFHNPFGDGTKTTSCYAIVINHGINCSTWINTVKLLLLAVKQPAPLAPSALVDITATNGGWDAVSYQLTLVSHEYGDNSRDPHDGERFVSGDYISIIEASPADPNNPQRWGPIEVDGDYGDDGENILTLANGTTLSGWVATREYIVEPGDWDEVASTQQWVTYIADGTWMIDSNIFNSFRFG